MILLFSHQLTESQREDAETNWGIDDFVAFPDDLQKIWSNIDPGLDSLIDYLLPIYTFIDEVGSDGDVILIQGDFGACYNLVHYVKSKNMIPVYATTKRTVEEYTENEKSIKKSIFEHRRFRKYE